jgi:hypothetical protein
VKGAPAGDPGDEHLAVTEPKRWAAGIPGFVASVCHIHRTVD